MKILKLIFFILAFTLLLNFVHAAEVSVKVVPVQDVALSGSPAIFDVEITNNGPRGEVKAIVTDFNWRKDSDYGFYTIDGGSTIQDTFKLSPIGTLAPGKYSVNVRIYATRSPEDYVDQAFVIDVVSYGKLLDAKLDYNPQGLSPNKENLLTLKLINPYNINLNSVNIKVRSGIFDKDLVSNIGKKETKDLPFSAELGNVNEGDYEVNVFGLVDNNVVINLSRMIKVASYTDIKETKKEEFSFLVKILEVGRTNYGNTVSKEVYSKILSSFDNLFTKVTPDPSNVEKLGGAYKYSWEFSLNPGDSYSVSIKTDYGKPILIFILIVLLIYLIYKRANAGLKITKKVLMLRSREGNVVGLKVLLILKNSGSALKNIHLTDNIPGLLELPHEYGTLKPSSTKQGVAGSGGVWDIHELIKGEERVISYKMKSRVSGLSKLTIPRAICRYKDGMGKIYIARSNPFDLL